MTDITEIAFAEDKFGNYLTNDQKHGKLRTGKKSSGFITANSMYEDWVS